MQQRNLRTLSAGQLFRLEDQGELSQDEVLAELTRRRQTQTQTQTQQRQPTQQQRQQPQPLLQRVEPIAPPAPPPAAPAPPPPSRLAAAEREPLLEPIEPIAPLAPAPQLPERRPPTRAEVLEAERVSVQEAARGVQQGVVTPEEIRGRFDPESARQVLEFAERFPEGRAEEIEQRIEQVGISEVLETGFATREEIESLFGAEETERLLEEERRQQDILGRVGETIQDASQALEEGRVSETELREVFAPETVEQITMFGPAMATLQNRGFADDEGQVDVVGASEAGLEDALLEIGFSEEDIQQAQEQQQEGQIAAQRLTRQAFDPGAELAFDQLQAQGFVDEQGGVDVLGAQQAGLQGLLLQAGFTEEQLEQAVERQQEQQIAAGRLVRQTFDPGQQLAVDRLEQLGFADAQGIDVGEAALEGQRDLLLQAGFSPEQIDAAVSAITVPVAEPRLRPAPGETLPVDPEITDKLNEIEQERATFIEQTAGFTGLSPTGATITAESVTPEFQALERQAALVKDLKTSVETGDLTNEQAREILENIPEEPTEQDVIQARRNLGTQLQIAGGVPVVGLPLAATGTALTFAEDSPLERGLNVGLDAISLVPLAGAATTGARLAGAARGLARARGVASEVAAAELTPFFLNPKQLVRGTITDPVEAVIRPSRVIGAEETFTTLRLSAPGEQGRQIKSALSDAAIDLMQTGQTASRRVEELDANVTVRAGALHRTIGPNAVHTTPDGRNILAGPITVSGREGGLFVSPTPMTRFAQATAFGGEVPLTDEARAAVQAGRLPDEPVPTAVLIRDPELLRQLEPALDEAGRPKLFNNLAEIEALLPNGTVIPQASQVRFFRGAGGERVALAVVGEPLTAAEQARLRVGGLAQAARNIFSPGALLDFEGPQNVRTALKAEVLSTNADELRSAAREARSAGQADEARRLEDIARRVEQRAQRLSGAAGARAVPEPARDAAAAERPPDLDVRARADVARQPGVPATARADLAARAPGPALSRAEVQSRIATVSQLANAATSRTLTQAEQQQAQRVSSDLARAETTPQERTQIESDLDRLRQVTGLPLPSPRVAPEVTPDTDVRIEPPTAPRQPISPRAPVTPRPPVTPRVPIAPRTRITPTPPEFPPTERPRPVTPELPSEEPPEEEPIGEKVRVVGLNRGFLDTAVDLQTGRINTDQEIAGIEEGRIGPTILDRDPEGGGLTRVPWGFHDALVDEDGQIVQWIEPLKKGEKDNPSDTMKKGRKSGNPHNGNKRRSAGPKMRRRKL